MVTLPDYLKHGLDLVFVGINPGAYSASVGKYFATPQNRFWAALNRAGILPVERDLGPGDEKWLNEIGVGFTDVVKRASNTASTLKAADFRQWAPVLREKIEKLTPLVVCFNGLIGYRKYLEFAERHKANVELGPQARLLGKSKVFVAPNPSPANAAYSLDVIAEWYRKLGAFRDELKQATA